MAIKETMKDKLYEEFVKHGIIKKGHFLLSSGKHAEYYVDKDKICTIPLLYNEVIQQLSNMLMSDMLMSEWNKIDVITGPAVAGIAYAAPVAYYLRKKFVYPEKKEVNGKDLMQFRNIFHDTVKDKNIVIIEDIVTTGGSIRKTVKAIESLGGNVYGIVSIFDRSKDALTDIGNSIDSLMFTKSLITIYIESWSDDSCPLCYLNDIPLTDPKTDGIIKF